MHHRSFLLAAPLTALALSGCGWWGGSGPTETAQFDEHAGDDQHSPDLAMASTAPGMTDADQSIPGLEPTSLGSPAPTIPDRSRRPRDPAQEATARGAMLGEQGLYETALAEFIRAIELNPTIAAAHVGAGEILLKQGDYEQSRGYFERAISLEPDNFRAQYGLALTLQLEGRHAAAARTYERALAINPDDFDANLNLAVSYLALDRPTAAEPYAKLAVEVDPVSGPARVTLASVYDEQGRYEDAVVEFQQAFDLVELSPDLLLNFAEALGRTQRFEEMSQTLEQLVLVNPSAQAYERLGSASFRLKRWDKALESFEKAIQYDANHYPAWNGVAVCKLNTYVWSKKSDKLALDEAVAAMQRSLQIERRQPQVVELLTRYNR